MKTYIHNLIQCVISCSMQLAEAGIKNEAYTKDKMGIKVKEKFFSFLEGSDYVLIREVETSYAFVHDFWSIDNEDMRRVVHDYSEFIEWLTLNYNLK